MKRRSRQGPGGLHPDGKARKRPLYDLKAKHVTVFDGFAIRAEKQSAVKIADRDRTCFMAEYYVR